MGAIGPHVTREAHEADPPIAENPRADAGNRTPNLLITNPLPADSVGAKQDAHAPNDGSGRGDSASSLPNRPAKRTPDAPPRPLTARHGPPSQHEHECETCGSRFRSYNPAPRYCSRDCKSEAQATPVDPVEIARLYHGKGMSQHEVAERLGVSQKVIHKAMRRHAIASRPAAKRNQRGARNHMWKGDKAGYQALHARVQNARGTPSLCSVCGRDDDGTIYDWANLTGDYTDVDDYARMCRSCHHRFDGRAANLSCKEVEKCRGAS